MKKEYGCGGIMADGGKCTSLSTLPCLCDLCQSKIIRQLESEVGSRLFQSHATKQVSFESVNDALKTIPKVSVMYGLHIGLDDRVFEALRLIQADKHVDIVVSYKDRVREFSLQEFLKCVGYETEEKE